MNHYASENAVARPMNQACSVECAPQSQVQTAMQCLDKELNQLGELIQSLDRRLAIVCRNEPACPKTADKDPECRVEFVMRMKYKLVKVWWLDSSGRWGWSREICNHPTRCVSVGWLVAKSKRCLTLVGNVTKESLPQQSGEITIPRCCVTKMKQIG